MKIHNKIQDTFLPSLLQKIQIKKPALARIMSQYGNLTISEYLTTFSKNEATPIQPREEMIIVAEKLTKSLLGENIAQALRKELSETPVILTGNHHCPDYFPFTLQGSILFGLSKKRASVVPVIACADIPLNNANNPRGIITATNVKVNIFPEKMKHMLVSHTPPINQDMIINAVKKVDMLHKNGVIESHESAVLQRILQQEYLSPSVLQQDSYALQISVLNQRIWKKIFSKEMQKNIPDMVYLEMETIITSLLQKDLENTHSFISELFFNPLLRSRAILQLQRVFGCWDDSRLTRLNDASVSQEERKSLQRNCGTKFFWGIDKKRRRFPLQLIETRNGLQLQGVDDSGIAHEYAFTPNALHGYLQEKSLLPSLFISYTSLAFIRGFKCYGGFMQTDYLTEMKQNLVIALTTSGFENWAKKVSTVPTENYITGMIHTVTFRGNDDFYSAGALDYIGNGGLTEQNVEKIKALKIKDANLFGIKTMYEILYENKLDTESLHAAFKRYFGSFQENLVKIPMKK